MEKIIHLNNELIASICNVGGNIGIYIWDADA